VTAPFGAALAEALPRMRRYAIALAGDVATADDLLQDCMERGWMNQAAITDEWALFRRGSNEGHTRGQVDAG
jgi:DNA-directed RNA polymerase specialized sigma24 family protein